MERNRVPVATLIPCGAALLCWVMMFLAGHDIWHDAGRPDLSRLGPTQFDLRAFAYAFYLLPVPLLMSVAFSAFTSRKSPSHG